MLQCFWYNIFESCNCRLKWSCTFVIFQK
jgi:hypothetical protein